MPDPAFEVKRAARRARHSRAPTSGRSGRRFVRPSRTAGRSSRTSGRALSCTPRSRDRSRAPAGRTAGPSRLSNGDSSTAAVGAGGERSVPVGTTDSRAAVLDARAAREGRPRRAQRPRSTDARHASPQPPVLDDPRLGERPPRLNRLQAQAAAAAGLGRRWVRRAPPWGAHAGEVVQPLKALPTGDDEVAVVPEPVEHRLRRLPVPHPTLARALEVDGSPGAPRRSNLLQDLVGEMRVRLAHRRRPAGARPCFICGGEERPVWLRQQARLVRPVLEHAPAGEKPQRRPRRGSRRRGRRARCGGSARPRDRVELHARKPADRGVDLPRRARSRGGRTAGRGSRCGAGSDNETAFIRGSKFDVHSEPSFARWRDAQGAAARSSTAMPSDLNGVSSSGRRGDPWCPAGSSPRSATMWSGPIPSLRHRYEVVPDSFSVDSRRSTKSVAAATVSELSSRALGTDPPRR